MDPSRAPYVRPYSAPFQGPEASGGQYQQFAGQQRPGGGTQIRGQQAFQQQPFQPQTQYPGQQQYPAGQQQYPTGQQQYPAGQQQFLAGQQHYPAGQAAAGQQQIGYNQGQYYQAGLYPPPGSSVGQSSAGVVYPQSHGNYPKSPSQGGQWAQGQDSVVADKISRFAPTALARTTVGRVPGNNTVKAKAQIPLGIVLQPLATGVEVPVVNFGQSCRVVRCSKCRIYMNPFVKWMSNGNRWQCNFCDQENDTPNGYYCPLDASGEREDREERRELSHSAVDFVASPDYMNRPPMEPKYLIVLDVSLGAVQSGLVATAAETLKNVVSQDRLGGSERANFGLITFDSNVHFYTIQPNQSRVQISVVAGSADPYIPSVSVSFLLANESKNELCDLLDGLPTYWRNQETREANVLAAINAARSLLKNHGGKIILIMSTLPNNPELGLNPQHEFRDAKGRPATSRIPDEIDGLRPSSTYFTTLTNTMAHAQICIDLLAAPPSLHSLDLASISELARGSGGQFYYYPAFRPQIWGDKFSAEFDRCLTAKCGWEAVMRVRVSKGWTVKTHYGNFCFRGVDLMMLPCFNEDSTVAVTFDNVDSVVADPICYLQSAVLYSTSDGERRIRTTTTALPTTLVILFGFCQSLQRLPDLAASVDIQTTARFLVVKAMEEGLKGKLADARTMIHSAISNIAALLGIVHQSVAPAQDPYTPLDPANALQMMCLMCAGMLKCPAFREGKDSKPPSQETPVYTFNSVPPDLRVYFWNRVRSMPVSVIQMFSPVMFEITQLPPQAGTVLDSGGVIFPPSLRLTGRIISGNGAYLACDGESIYIWVGRGVAQTWISQAFGVQSFDQIVPDYSELAFGSSSGPIGTRLANIVKQLRIMHSYNYLKIHVCKQGDPAEFRFTQLLIEDKSHAVGVSLMEIWQKYAASRSPIGTVNQPPAATTATAQTGFSTTSMYR